MAQQQDAPLVHRIENEEAPVFIDTTTVFIDGSGIKVSLGSVLPTAEPEARLTVRDVFSFAMSAEYALIFYQQLGQQLERFEDKYGQIRKTSDEEFLHYRAGPVPVDRGKDSPDGDG